MPRLFSYVVAFDFGFAPNPFHGYCTLATCKPDIRKLANVGDWVVGTSSVRKRSKHGIVPKLLYWMKVSEVLTFDEYWNDPRFQEKKTAMNSSKLKAYGDNIYRRDSSGEWRQTDSRHSNSDGTENKENLERDTGKTDKVLVSDNFVYMGKDAIPIPDEIGGKRLAKAGRSFTYKQFDEKFISDFEKWHNNLYFDDQCRGALGLPSDW